MLVSAYSARSLWNEEELRQLIAHSETTTVELKVAPPRPTELAERLCGMANTQGRTLIIGVEDGSLKIVGVQDARGPIQEIHTPLLRLIFMRNGSIALLVGVKPIEQTEMNTSL